MRRRAFPSWHGASARLASAIFPLILLSQDPEHARYGLGNTPVAGIAGLTFAAYVFSIDAIV